MFLAYLRVIFAFLALLFVAFGVAVLVYFWEHHVKPSRAARARIAELEKSNPERVDLGAKVFEQALVKLRMSDFEGAYPHLAEIMASYPDSDRYRAAKRIIGEHNLDRLLSNDAMAGKEEYIVQSGDSLSRIASRTKTTMQYIVQINNLLGTTLRKGEQLIICPLDFSLSIDLSDKTLQVLSGEKFFKEYDILGHRFPPRTGSDFDSSIAAKEAYDENGKGVAFGTDNYVTTSKYLRLEKRGVVIRSASPEEMKNEFTTGIFMRNADVEELNTILCNGSKVLVRK